MCLVDYQLVCVTYNMSERVLPVYNYYYCYNQFSHHAPGLVVKAGIKQYGARVSFAEKPNWILESIRNKRKFNKTANKLRPGQDNQRRYTRTASTIYYIEREAVGTVKTK